MSDNNIPAAGAATPAKPAAATPAAPAPAKRARRTGSLAQRYESLVTPQLVGVDDLPEALGTIREALTAAGEAELAEEIFGRAVPAGILGPTELLDLNRAAESLTALVSEVK